MLQRIRNAVAIMRRPDFPYRDGADPMPYLLYSMFWVGFWAAIVAVPAMIVVTLRETEVIPRVLRIAAVRITFDPDPMYIAFGLIGGALAYGIYKERWYPRPLAILALLLFATWSLWSTLSVGTIDSGAIIGAVTAIGSILYLARSPEVIEYYRRRREAS